MILEKSRIAAAVVSLTLASSLTAMACPSDQTKPFTAGPLMTQPADPNVKWAGPFSEWVVDMNGVGLQICTDSVDALGNPPPCFFDPVDPANAYTSQLTRGGEAFWYLAENAFATTGAFPLTAVIVMGVESAFLSDPPAPGFETQFQRLRTRINVAAVGEYTVETPWSKKTYRVTTLLRPGNGQSRMEISEPIDITFNPNASNAGLVAPFLIPTNRGAVSADYIGDGLTPTTVTGSPCGTNFIRVTAVGLDGTTPININNGSNVFTSSLFTVQGKFAPTSAVPLSIGAAFYTRTAGADKITVMAQGSTSSSQAASATAEVNGVVTTLVKDGNRFYASVPSPTPVVLPQVVTVRAEDPGRPSVPNTQTTSLKDMVVISSAVATCTGAGENKCTLRVSATSSDDGSGADGAPVLTLQHLPATPWTGGTATVSSAAVPAAVTVMSSKGGVAVKPVTIVN
ncbi:MAG: hypothetical protein IPG93_20025 [Burkholderiales bacterium]|nr:hypothetical protein [Burkholderiales bacterium]